MTKLSKKIVCRYKVFECTQNAYNGATRTNNSGDVFCRSTSTNYHDATNGNVRAGPRYGKRAACARRSFEPLKVRSTMPTTDNAGDGADEATAGADGRRRRGRLRSGAREVATNEMARPATGEAGDR